LYGKDLGDEIRKHDVYVTAARWEACGSHHVEAAACGLPIVYHAEGGGVAEMCSRYGVGIDKVQDFSSALHKLTKDYDIYYNMLKDHDFSAHAMCDKYHQIMKASQ
jgi:glycosyltransferase involved in cell wall biosynthesis